MDSFTRHYVVRPGATAPAVDPELQPWTIVCDGRELASMPGRDAALALATKIARADADEFGTETTVLVENDDREIAHACFGKHAKLS